MIEWLFEHDENCRAEMVSRIYHKAEQNQLMLWLYKTAYHEDPTRLRSMGDVAASVGDIETVRWLHELNPPNCFTTRAIDGAANNGHVDVVRFLLVNRSEGLADLAVCGALMHNHDEIFKILRPNSILEKDITLDYGREAGKHGRLDLLQLDMQALTRSQPQKEKPRRPPHSQRKCYPWGSIDASMNAEVSVLRSALLAACEYGQLNVVKWLAEVRGFDCDSEAVERAALNGHIHVLEWLHTAGCGGWGYDQ